MTPQELDILFKGLEVIALILGAGTILVRMGRMMGEFKIIGEQQAVEISEMKTEIKTLSMLITTVAVQKVEMAGLREDIALLRQWYDELRRATGQVNSDLRALFPSALRTKVSET